MKLTGCYEVRRKIELHDPTGKVTGFTTEPDGYIECEFRVEVDEEKLIGMIGHKAAFSKRGVSMLQSGAVKLHVTRKTRIPKGAK